MQDPTKLITGFGHLISHLENGALNADLTTEMAEILKKNAEFAEGAGGGRATATLVVELTFTQELETVKIQGNIKSKTQKTPRRSSMLFVTPIEHRLSLEHPQQSSLFSVSGRDRAAGERAEA